MPRFLQIVSHFPGRLRVRAEPFRAGSLGAEVAEKVRGEPGVSTAIPSSLTGSLLVEYQPREVQLPRLVELILEAGQLEAIALDRSGPPAPHGPSIRAALDRWNEKVVDASRGRLDARSAIPGTLAGLGVLRLVLGPARLPEWYDLMFWSFVTFINLNPPTEPKAEDDRALWR